MTKLKGIVRRLELINKTLQQNQGRVRQCALTTYRLQVDEIYSVFRKEVGTNYDKYDETEIKFYNNIIQNLITNIIERINKETTNNSDDLNETLKTNKKLTLKTTTHIIISLLAAYKRQKQFVPITHGAIKTNTNTKRRHK